MTIRESLGSFVAAALCAAALVACGASATPVTATACAALAAPDPALDQPIEPDAIDQRRFDEAVRHAVNQVRCDGDIAPLAGDPAIARAASHHSGDMVRQGFFDHISPVEGRRTPGDRLHQVGVEYRRAAENIAQISLYALDGKRFFLRRGRCAFSFTPDGPLIGRYTFIEAAERLVEQWMKSPGHRRNILDPEVARHGAGVAFRAQPTICGELIVTQNFAD